MLSKTKSCKQHFAITDSERGETFCNYCGVVLTEKLIDRTHENNYFDEFSTKNNARTGPATSLSMYDKGLYTVIGNNIDSTGRTLSSKTKSNFERLRTWDKRSKSVSLGRNLGTAFIQLDAIKTKLGIPDNVMEETAYLYRKVVAKQIFRGRPIAPVLAACLYASCRSTNTPRSLDDIAKTANVKKTLVSRALRQLVRGLNMRLEQYNIQDFVTRLANNLDLDEKTKRRAFEILEYSKNQGVLEGKNPMGFAATSVYLACLENKKSVSQTLISNLSGISCVTIRNTAAQIRRKITVLP